MATILGIDEAGRGPVIGPMVLAGVAATEDEIDRLTNREITDSKQMTGSARERERAFLKEESNCTLFTHSLSAREINRNSLTELTLRGMVRLIESAKPDRVVFDAPGHPSSLDDYQQRLADRLDVEPVPDLHGEPKADERYPIVSAASVVAKTNRDKCIDQLQEEFGELGSGYPSDPATRSFLSNHLSPDEPVRKYIRTRWKTFQDLVSDAGGPLFVDS